MDARGFSFSSIGDGAEFHRRQRLIVDCTKDSVGYSRLKSSDRLTGWINRLWGNSDLLLVRGGSSQQNGLQVGLTG